MKSFCIIGLNTFGQTLALTLSQNGHQVMVIDEDNDIVNVLADQVTNAVVGDPTNEAVLRAAGIKDYDCAVICFDDDMNASILLTLTLKDLGVPKVVARAINDKHSRVLRRVGADDVVFPERDMGEKVAYTLDKNNVLEFIEFSNEYSIVEIKVPDHWIGKTLSELEIRRKYKVNVIAVSDHVTGRMDISLTADRVFAPGEQVTLLGANQNIDKIVKN